MTTPVTAAQNLARAHLEVVSPRSEGDADNRIPLRFNPTDFKISKSNTFAEVGIPGLETPPIQYVRGGSESLTLEALVDTSDTLDDVRVAFVGRLRALMTPDTKLHAPPIVRFVWGPTVFVGVLEKLDVTYQMFQPDGVPLRAKLDLTLKEYRDAARQSQDPPRSSSTVEKTYSVLLHDTLSIIAGKVYGDPGAWRVLARANGIDDPAELRPGMVLIVPRLR